MAMLSEHKDLGRLLLEEGLITREQLDRARATQSSQEKSIGRVLVDMGVITEEAKIAFIHKKLGHEIVDIRDMEIDASTTGRISLSFAEKHRCVPILIEEDRLVMAMEDPTDIAVLDAIKTQTGMDPLPVLAPVRDIEQALQQIPRLSQQEADALIAGRTAPLWARVLHPLLFMLIMIAPLAMFFVLVKYSDAFSNFAWQLGEPFDVMLYLVLSWALWAILLWEIDSLLFSRSSRSG